jgi:hypothetical protein
MARRNSLPSASFDFAMSTPIERTMKAFEHLGITNSSSSQGGSFQFALNTSPSSDTHVDHHAARHRATEAAQRPARSSNRRTIGQKRRPLATIHLDPASKQIPPTRSLTPDSPDESQSSILPSELLLKVLMNLASSPDDKQTLVACATVSRLWKVYLSLPPFETI